MAQARSRYRWFVVFVFFLFVLLHQADKLLISPLTTPIMETFNINEAQMGAVSTAALLVAALFFVLWGYLYDRFSRSRLLALASFIWGSTTWLNALAPNYSTFLATRASTGVDDASYPGIFSLLSDYFGPRLRGKVYGLIQVAQPIGFMMGTLLATMLGGSMGWRSVFFITGSAGIVVAILIFFGVREPVRGQAEPELAGLEDLSSTKINWGVVKGLLKKPSFLVLLSQGFFGSFPWQVLVFWFFRYLEVERGYTPDEAMLSMIIAIVPLSLGYLVGGGVGDFFFRRTPRGRVLTAMVGVLAGAVFLALLLTQPTADGRLSVPLLALMGLTMSIASPNVIATVQDVTEPEVRGTAQSVMSLADTAGSALAPFLAGLIAVSYSLHAAILTICISTWLLCAVLFGVTAIFIPGDVARLRQEMEARARAERAEDSGA
jgi:MFS family permease